METLEMVTETDGYHTPLITAFMVVQAVTVQYIIIIIIIIITII